MASKPRSTINTEIATYIADNTAGEIDASDIRTRLVDLNDSLFNMTTDGIGQITGLQANLNSRIVGPASSANNNIALFDGTTGKLLKDAGVALSAKADASHTHPISDVTSLQANLNSRVVGPASSANNHVVVFDGTTGKLIKSVGYVLGSSAQLDEALTAEIRSNIANKVVTTDQYWPIYVSVALTDDVNIALDMTTGINFTLTLAGNRTLSNPTNIKNQKGWIRVQQDATGSRTLAYGTYYKFAGGTAPTLTAAANAVDLLFYDVLSSTEILIRPILDVK